METPENAKKWHMAYYIVIIGARILAKSGNLQEYPGFKLKTNT